MAHSQHLFGPEPNNLQFIEMYVDEFPGCTNRAFGKEKQLHTSINMKEVLGLDLPLGHEFYCLMSEVIIPKVGEFKPDIIIYMEDIDSSEVGVKSDIRGLILNDLSAKVQNKIYVFIEFGMTNEMVKEGRERKQIQQYFMLPTNWKG